MASRSSSSSLTAVPKLSAGAGANVPIPVRFTKTQLARAKARGEELGRLNGSITKGKSNIFGMLGEEIVASFLGAAFENRKPQLYQYDLILPNGTTADVKTKKTTSKVPPRPHYTATVWNGNTSQQCDRYIFVRVCTDLDLGLAWICGQLPKEEFYTTSVFYMKGQHDAENNYTVHADCHNIRIDQLKPVVAPNPWAGE
ncbi:MAG: hypothetical protein CL450_05915 [Acidimicrobiaceae bacterium]|nr:hypothetical protein [Acidimicrobiaceae bacterium]|tara:strand:- start:3567 stop:4163 length:597 start_codon:yes stop_codon:yes gene_type:complete